MIARHTMGMTRMNAMMALAGMYAILDSADPVCGTTEIWEFVNTTTDAHPIHLHAVHFQVLDR